MSIINSVLQKINLTGNRKKVLKNVYWAVLGKIVNVLSGLFVGILVARYLGPDNFGLMNYVISYVTLFSILSNFGLDNIEIRELAKNPEKTNIVMGTAFRLRLFFALIAISLVFITLLIFESDRFTFIMVMVYSLSLLLSTLNVIRNYFTSIVLNEYVVKTEIFRTIIGAGAKVILLLYKAPLEWFILASTFDFLLVASGYLLSYRKNTGDIIKWTFNKEIAKFLIKESFPMLLSGAAIIIYQKIDLIMIRNMIDNASVGQFAVASRITDLAIFMPMVIAQTVTPLLVKLHEENYDLYIEKRKQFIDFMLWGAILMAILMTLFAKPAITILFGDKYLLAIPVLHIIAWKVIFVSLFNATGQIIIIEGIQKFAAIRNVVGCFVSVLLNLILIPKLGIIGSAWAIIATLSFSGYFSHFFIKPYQFLFKLETESILKGWKSIFELNQKNKL